MKKIPQASLKNWLITLHIACNYRIKFTSINFRKLYVTETSDHILYIEATGYADRQQLVPLMIIIHAERWRSRQFYQAFIPLSHWAVCLLEFTYIRPCIMIKTTVISLSIIVIKTSIIPLYLYNKLKIGKRKWKIWEW